MPHIANFAAFMLLLLLPIADSAPLLLFVLSHIGNSAAFLLLLLPYIPDSAIFFAASDASYAPFPTCRPPYLPSFSVHFAIYC